MGNIVSEDFKFIGYINQYHSEGIYFTFRIKPDTITDKNYSKAGDSTFFSPFVDNEIIEIAVIEKFYKRRWQELEPEYLELDFVESDIKLLLSFSDEIKTNYRKQFNPLLKYFKTKLIELNNPYPIIKSLVTEKPELLNFHNEVIQSFNMIHLFIKPKGGSWIDGAYIPDKEYIVKKDISSIIEKQFLKMFLEVIPNAKTEIENIIFQNGSGTERVVNKILSDLNHCQEGFDLISNNLSIIAFTQIDDIELSQRNYETLSDGEKDFHISFVKVSNLFYEYFKYFIEVSGLKILSATDNQILQDGSSNQFNNHSELFIRLKQYGFYELKAIKDLSLEGTDKLNKMIVSNEKPFQIALFTVVGFDQHLQKSYSLNRTELVATIATNIFLNPSAKRSIKGLLNVLNEVTTEDKKKYTSWQHIETIKKELANIK